MKCCHLKYFTILLFVFFCLISCKAKIKFDTAKWRVDDIDYQVRNAMVDDLVTHYHIKGLNYKKLIDLLGEPNGAEKDSSEIWYDLDINYDIIDPVSGKELIIKLNTDSIVTGFYINDWKRK